jgi:hypothetical protein
VRVHLKKEVHIWADIMINWIILNPTLFIISAKFGNLYIKEQFVCQEIQYIKMYEPVSWLLWSGAGWLLEYLLKGEITPSQGMNFPIFVQPHSHKLLWNNAFLQLPSSPIQLLQMTAPQQ